jgi:hypothetical protein
MGAPAMRKRRLSDIVYQQILNDAVHAEGAKSGTGPGGQRGDDSDTARLAHIPTPAHRRSRFPDPSPLLVQTEARSGRLLGFRRLYDFAFNVGS